MYLYDYKYYNHYPISHLNHTSEKSTNSYSQSYSMLLSTILFLFFFISTINPVPARPIYDRHALVKRGGPYIKKKGFTHNFDEGEIQQLKDAIDDALTLAKQMRSLSNQIVQPIFNKYFSPEDWDTVKSIHPPKIRL